MKFYARLGRRGRVVLWFGTTALFFLALSLLVYGVFALIVSPEREGGTILYKSGTGSRSDRTYEVPRETYCPGGVPYVEFAAIAEACGFSVSGDESSIRYLIETAADGEESRLDTVTFYYGSREILVNGTHYMLAGAVHKEGDRLFVPAEFIRVCMNGVTVETTASSITVVYDPASVSLKPDLRPIDPIQT